MTIVLLFLVTSFILIGIALLVRYKRNQKNHHQYLMRINWLEINALGYGANARKKLRNHCSWNEIQTWERMVNQEEVNYELLTKLEKFYGKKS